jgi:hypothetical protein
MPLPGPPVKQTREEAFPGRRTGALRVARPIQDARLRAESVRYRDSDEVIAAVEELAMSSPDMSLLPYGTLRAMLTKRPGLLQNL